MADPGSPSDLPCLHWGLLLGAVSKAEVSAAERKEVCGCEVTKCKTVNLLSFTTLNMHACKNVGLILKLLLLEQKIPRKKDEKIRQGCAGQDSFSTNLFFFISNDFC